MTGVLPLGTTSAQVQKATLVLFVNRVVTPGTADLYTPSTGWSESTVTFDSLPPLVGPIQTAAISQSGTTESTSNARRPAFRHFKARGAWVLCGVMMAIRSTFDFFNIASTEE